MYRSDRVSYGTLVSPLVSSATLCSLACAYWRTPGNTSSALHAVDVTLSFTTAGLSSFSSPADNSRSSNRRTYLSTISVLRDHNWFRFSATTIWIERFEFRSIYIRLSNFSNSSKFHISSISFISSLKFLFVPSCPWFSILRDFLRASPKGPKVGLDLECQVLKSLLLTNENFSCEERQWGGLRLDSFHWNRRYCLINRRRFYFACSN